MVDWASCIHTVFGGLSEAMTLDRENSTNGRPRRALRLERRDMSSHGTSTHVHTCTAAQIEKQNSLPPRAYTTLPPSRQADDGSEKPTNAKQFIQNKITKHKNNPTSRAKHKQISPVYYLPIYARAKIFFLLGLLASSHPPRRMLRVYRSAHPLSPKPSTPPSRIVSTEISLTKAAYPERGATKRGLQPRLPLRGRCARADAVVTRDLISPLPQFCPARGTRGVTGGDGRGMQRGGGGGQGSQYHRSLWALFTGDVSSTC